MTDEIRITRRIALEKYEFYEIQWTTKEQTLQEMVPSMEANVRFIRKYMEIPTPEISPKIAPLSKEQNDPYSDHLIYDGDTVRTKHFIHNKEKWGEINNYLKGLGYKWVSDGEKSRWER